VGLSENILSQKLDSGTFKEFKYKDIKLHLPELDAITTNEGRRYKTPNGLYPSVTTVLSLLNRDSILKWRAHVGEEEANRITKQATSRGSSIHKYCEMYLNNNKKLLEENIMPFNKNSFLSIKKILDESVNNIYCLEVPLYSDYLKVAGRVDLIAEYNGNLSIIDFKTSRKEKTIEGLQGYFMQTACYAVMFEERTEIPVKNCVIIINNDETGTNVHQVDRDKYIFDFIKLRNKYSEEYNFWLHKYQINNL